MSLHVKILFVAALSLGAWFRASGTEFHSQSETNQLISLMLKELTDRGCFDQRSGMTRPKAPVKRTQQEFFAGDGEWPADERQAAFDWFLNNLQRTATRRLSIMINPLGNAAVKQCGLMGYTNAVSILRANALGPDDGCRLREIETAVMLSPDTRESVEFIRAIVTNKTTFCEGDRGYAFDVFAEAFSNAVAASGRSVQPSEAAMQLYSFVSDDPEYAQTADAALCHYIGGYAHSSNRLASIRGALMHVHSMVEDRPDFSEEVSSWKAITNQLLNASQPLVQLELP